MKILQGLLALFCLLAANLYAAPSSEYWPIWDKANASNSATIDHSRWQQFLDSYLSRNESGTTLVSYGEVSERDQQTLDAYIEDLAEIDPLVYQRDEQKAYWINFYNALTVQLILKNYPVESITDLGGLFSFGPWNDELVSVNGIDLTLNDIEHRILRPIWNDKRIHYAVNCASIGCPNLLQTAFTAESLEALMEQAAMNFINQEKAVAFEGNTLILSSIYDWYAVDFGSREELKIHLSQYLDNNKSALLSEHNEKTKFRYNWNLNDAS